MDLADRRRHHRDELEELWAFAATLDDAALRTPSLCAGWTVADVLGHVAAWERLLVYDRPWQQPLRLARLGAAVLRAGGSTDRLNEQLDSAPWPPAGAAGRHLFDRSAPGSQLAELVVHGEDIRRPLGARRTIPADRLELALEGVLRLPGVGARRRAEALAGEPPSLELLLRLAGREV